VEPLVRVLAVAGAVQEAQGLRHHLVFAEMVV
jgi:hypothetical protein